MRWILVLGGVVVVAALLLVSSCSATQPNRDPTGEVFPSVVGESLAEQSVRLPEDYAGKKLLVLVGYEQESQFDIDRWLGGLLQARVPVRYLEVPTLDGLLSRFARGWIDDGMRSGIPEEDWAGVVTVYGDARKIIALTGNENRRNNARVLLLDEEGRVLWFHDRGYSPRLIAEIAALVGPEKS